MAYRDSPSSIPRPRITSSHFRPLPEGPQHGSSIPRPLASPSSLLVSRKRPRAETVASTSPRPARQSHILQSTCLESTTLSSPRAFSASFAASPTVLPPNGIEESWLSAATCPSQAQAADHNGHSNQDLHTPRPHSTSAEPDLPTWKTSLFSTAAAVATKVWDFARNNKFFGFRAGGGTAYDMHTGLPQQFDEGIIYTSESLSLATPNQAQNDVGVHHHPDHDQDENKDDESIRAAKRRQTSSGGDWILVSPETSQAPDSPSVSAKPSVQLQSHIPRPSPRAASSARRRSHLSPSAASPRRTSTALTSLNTSSNGGSRRSSIQTSTFTSKPLRSARSLSSFSPQPLHNISDSAHTRTTPKSTRTSTAHTITSADVARYRAKKEREERKQDASMRKLNDQLRAMIREGKEALGTTVDVELELGSEDELGH